MFKKKIMTIALCGVLAVGTILPSGMNAPVNAAAKPKLASTSLYVAKGKKVNLVVKNKKKTTITYKSKNTKIATVTAKGVVKGKKVGTTKIAVNAKKGTKTYKLSAKIYVKKGAKKLTVTNKTVTMNKGKSVAIVASISPKNSDVISYVSSKKSIATVSAKGVVKGVGVGNTTVTVKTLSGKTVKVKVSVTRPVLATSLKEAYKDDFKIGTAFNAWFLNFPARKSIITSQFNSITMENAMKPDALLDQKACQATGSNTEVKIKTDTLEKCLKDAKDNGLQLRGHTLVWHSQTPDWFFKENYSGTKFVSKEVMLSRMENYIKTVMEYCQNNYPGVVYAWDVVNEAVSDGSGDYRTMSNWYNVFGDGSFIESAFTYAAKYRADGVKLFLNDYNEYAPAKRDKIYKIAKSLYDKGILDGVGMQSHLVMDYPGVDLIEQAIKKYASISPNLEIQLTELDIHNTDNSKAGNAALAKLYGDLFSMLVRLDRAKEANITSVTFWAFVDSDTWLTSFRGETSYPALFDDDLVAKPAYDAVLAAAAK